MRFATSRQPSEFDHHAHLPDLPVQIPLKAASQSPSGFEQRVLNASAQRFKVLRGPLVGGDVYAPPHVRFGLRCTPCVVCALAWSVHRTYMTFESLGLDEALLRAVTAAG